MLNNPAVSREEWIAARTELLKREKELTRARDRLAADRRALPWLKIEKNYVFDGPEGKVSLAELFDGRSQLFIQHFMFAPEWSEGCVGCSFGADHVDAARQHFEHNDLSFAAIARAPIEKLEAYRKRMGWGFRFLSSANSDFNYDFNVSFKPEQVAAGRAFYNYREDPIDREDLPGSSVFYRTADGEIFLTYSCFARGGEEMTGAFMFLDLVPKGRNETINGDLTDWVRHHDKYDAANPSCCCKA